MSLCFLLLFSLMSGCSKKQRILPEVVEAFKIDEATEESVEELFASFDRAFAALEKHTPVDDEDFSYFHNSVLSARLYFDYDTDDKLYTAYRNLSNSSNSNNETVQKLIAEYEAIIIGNRDMLSHIHSPEGSFEAAVNLVNAHSQFFYGENWITDDDIDRID